MRAQFSKFLRGRCGGVVSGLLSVAWCLTIGSHVATADWQKVNEGVREQIAMLQPSIGPHNIEIDYTGPGNVTLTGEVESEEALRRVEDAAERVPGVARVNNHITVVKAGPHPQSEEAKLLEDAFRREIPRGTYQMRVISERDSVILQGTADSAATHDQLLSVASSVVKRPVKDQITIQRALQDADIEAAIRQTLMKEYPGLIKELDISVSNGVASLSGDLSSHVAIDKVLATVLMVDGVKDIQSSVTINGRPYTSAKKADRY